MKNPKGIDMKALFGRVRKITRDSGVIIFTPPQDHCNSPLDAINASFGLPRDHTGECKVRVMKSRNTNTIPDTGCHTDV